MDRRWSLIVVAVAGLTAAGAAAQAQGVFTPRHTTSVVWEAPESAPQLRGTVVVQAVDLRTNGLPGFLGTGALPSAADDTAYEVWSLANGTVAELVRDAVVGGLRAKGILARGGRRSKGDAVLRVEFTEFSCGVGATGLCRLVAQATLTLDDQSASLPPIRYATKGEYAGEDDWGVLLDRLAEWAGTTSGGAEPSRLIEAAPGPTAGPSSDVRLLEIHRGGRLRQVLPVLGRVEDGWCVLDPRAGPSLVTVEDADRLDETTARAPGLTPGDRWVVVRTDGERWEGRLLFEDRAGGVAFVEGSDLPVPLPRAYDRLDQGEVPHPSDDACGLVAAWNDTEIEDALTTINEAGREPLPRVRAQVERRGAGVGLVVHADADASEVTLHVQPQGSRWKAVPLERRSNGLWRARVGFPREGEKLSWYVEARTSGKTVARIGSREAPLRLVLGVFSELDDLD